MPSTRTLLVYYCSTVLCYVRYSVSLQLALSGIASLSPLHHAGFHRAPMLFCRCYSHYLAAVSAWCADIAKYTSLQRRSSFKGSQSEPSRNHGRISCPLNEAWKQNQQCVKPCFYKHGISRHTSISSDFRRITELSSDFIRFLFIIAHSSSPHPQPSPPS